MLALFYLLFLLLKTKTKGGGGGGGGRVERIFTLSYRRISRLVLYTNNGPTWGQTITETKIPVGHCKRTVTVNQRCVRDFIYFLASVETTLCITLFGGSCVCQS